MPRTVLRLKGSENPYAGGQGVVAVGGEATNLNVKHKRVSDRSKNACNINRDIEDRVRRIKKQQIDCTAHATTGRREKPGKLGSL